MGITLSSPPIRSKIIICMLSEINILITTIVAGIASLVTLYLNIRSKNRIDENEAKSKQNAADIEALQKAVATYQLIITEKDKLIDVYKKELDELLMKYDKLQAKNETLTAEIESLNKRILELEKN